MHYCWPTPTYRNLCVQHTFFEGKKAEETSSRKSTPRTLKWVGQQYPEVFEAPRVGRKRVQRLKWSINGLTSRNRLTALWFYGPVSSS
jgi:hypothetical protein